MFRLPRGHGRELVLDVAASVPATTVDDDFEKEMLVQVDPGDPGPLDAQSMSPRSYHSISKLPQFQ